MSGEQKYILALDQGTTSSRAVIFDKKINKLVSCQEEFSQIYPHPGWVEHDPEELFDCQLNVMKRAIAESKVSSDEIAAVGITNQRETVILWDKNTGKPVYNAIVWQCRRTANMAEELVKQGKSQMIQDRTGLLPDAYFSGTKIKWILDNVDGVRERAEKGEILCGTVDTWLIWKLSGGKAHVTDYTNASRTMLFNIFTLEWDDELLELMEIPKCILPEVRDSSCVYTNTSREVCGVEIPIASAIGDQQAALFGQGCFSPGEAKVTYGTGCFLLMNTGKLPFKSKHKLITTIAIGLDGGVEYALEGSVFIGGAIVKWLRDELKIISSARECDQKAESVKDANGVVIVPAFTGLGAPYWDAYARGAILGLTRGVNAAHICRAALESIAYQVKDDIECMKDDSEIENCCLRVDGGVSVSDVMVQFQADILNSTVVRPKNIETTVTGAAFLAGLAVGFWKSKDDILDNWQVDKEFKPGYDEEKIKKLYSKWKSAVDRIRSWETE